MFRKDLIERLRRGPASLNELAREFEVPVSRVREDVEHVRRSLKHTGERLVVEPARCRKCGFAFTKAKAGRPGRCPKCRSTWIAEPELRIEGS
jgi:hypothetical protein